MESITLQVGNSIISSGDALGQIQFAAPAESDGGASRYIVGRVYGEAEGAFSASSNPASIVFATSAADNLPASGKIKISHEGHILPLLDNTYDLGSPDLRFRDLYVTSEVISPTGVFDYIYFDTNVGDIDLIEGQMNWNSEAGTVEIGLTDDLKMAVGQSLLFRVKNSTGTTLSAGQAVYASGVLGGGQIIQAAPFAVDNTVPEVRFIGLVTDDIQNGEDGYVNNFGHIKNVDLRSTNTTINPNGETWAVGDILFVDDSTPGGLTKVQPQDDIYVALVLADGQNGELFVRITDPGHINDLHDVNTSGVADNNLLVWNSGSDYWEPSSGLYYVDGDLGVGTTSPNATLHVYNSTPSGTVFNTEGTNGSLFSVVDNLSGVLMSVNTIAGLPVLEVNSDYSVTAGRFNQNDFVLTSSGNVGIGTDSPSTKLDVSGVVTVASLNVNNAFTLPTTDGAADQVIQTDGNGVLTWVDKGGGGAGDVSGSGLDGHIAYWNSASGITYDNAQLYWDSASNLLGIGTTTPEQKLHVNNGNIKVENATNPTIEYDDGAAVVGKIYYDTLNDTFVAKHNLVSGDEHLVLTSGGAVGIGTNSTTSTLHVYSATSGDTLFNVEGTNGSLFSVVDNLSGVLMSVNNNAGLPVFEVYDDDTIIAGRFAQNDFVLDTNGDLGLGTDSPVTKLDVSGVITASGGNSNEWNEAYDWVQASGTSSGGISNVVEDTTPQLGGDLDINNSNIIGSGNIATTGYIQVDNLKLDGNTLSSTNTNGDLILNANGTGALQVDSGGNNRGDNAVDLQKSRAASTQAATGLNSTISGGHSNTALGNYTSVGGGRSNSASGSYSTVGGGATNSASGIRSIVGGGCGNTASGHCSTVGGGNINVASGCRSTVSGGRNNSASGICSTVGGGNYNRALQNSSTVSGGSGNTASGYYSTIGGGGSNTASCNRSTVGGGGSNLASGDYSTVSGGSTNTASGTSSNISGGRNNSASACYSTVVGGYYGKASKYGELSHSAGRFAQTGDAQHSTLVARRNTTDATANQVLFLDGSSSRLTIPAETTWMFSIKLAAHNDTNNDGAWWTFRGGIRRDASNNTSLIGSVISEYERDTNMATATASVVADDTNEALEIRVTGVAAKNIRWVAVVDISQVSWGTP